MGQLINRFRDLARWLAILSPFAVVAVFPAFAYAPSSSKVLVWSLAVEALAITYGLWAWFAPTDVPSRRFNPVYWALVGYVGTLLLTSLMGEYLTGSIWGTLERGDGLIFYGHLVAFVYLTMLVLRPTSDYRRLLHSVVVAGAYTVAVAVRQAATAVYRPDVPWVRADSVFGNSNEFAHFLLFPIFFGLVLLGEHVHTVFTQGIAPANPWRRLLATWQLWWYGGLVAWLTYGLALTGSRGASLALLGGVGTTSCILVGHQLLSTKRRFKIVGQSLAVAAAVVLAAFAVGQSSFKDQLRPLFNYSMHPDGTAARRVAIWQAGLDGWSERWLVGLGWDTFRDVVDRHFPPQVMRDEGSIIIFDRAHNFLVDHLVAGGLLAAAAYAALYFTLVAVWLAAWRRRLWPPFALASLFGILIADFIFNLFGFPWIGSYIGWAVLLAIFAHLGQRPFDAPAVRPKLVRGVGATLLVTGLLAFLGSSLPMGTLLGLQLPRLRAQAVPVAIQATVRRYPQFAEDILLLLPEEQSLRTAVQQRPRSLQRYKEIFRYYERQGWPPEARPVVAEYVAEVQRLAPTHPVSHLMAATFAIVQGQYSEAIVSSEHAIALNPSLSLPYWVAVDAAGRAGQFDLAWDYVRRAQAAERDPDRPGRYLSSYSFRPARMHAFARLLIQQGQYQSAADILIEQVGLEKHFRQNDVRYLPGGDLALLVTLVQRVDQAKGLDQARQIARTISEKLPVLAQQLAPYLQRR